MKIISKIEDLKNEIKGKKSIGLVPTMGALHKGHLSLIEKCVQENDFSIVSIFVNPTQFGPTEDYDKYPRTLDADALMCDKAGVNIVFAPKPSDMYEKDYFENKETTLICPPYSVVDTLCGKSRVGHFDGVCTVVAKLFNITNCNKAYFGKKDAQQLFIIQKMVKELNFNVDIVPCPIVRENDGLAMSSRNTYLNNEQRVAALEISKALSKVKELKNSGINSCEVLCDTALAMMPNLDVEYVEIVSLDSFQKIDIIEQKALILIAARVLGSNSVRLIDNMEL